VSDRAPASAPAPDPMPAPDEAPPPRRPLLPPLGYPVIALVFGAILVFSFSRVLLAVSKDAAPAIALLMALNVLVGAALVAYGGRVRRRPVSFPLLMIGAAGVIGLGLFALNLNERPVEAPGEGGGPPAVRLELAAQGIKFDKQDLSMPAGAPVTLAFDNRDAGTPHNVAIFTDESAKTVVFRGALVTGPKTTTYSFTSPAKPGTYYFHCDVHPTQMNGTVTVTAGGEGSGPGGGEGAGQGAVSLVAKGLAFDPTKLTVSGGGQVTIQFDDQDPGTPHNVAVFKGSDANAPVLFRGDVVTGPAKTDYTFAAPPPGTYYFHCDVHPTQMKGTLTVT
jgi:plastocyanin